MRYDNDGVRAGVLSCCSHRSRRRGSSSHLCLDGGTRRLPPRRLRGGGRRRLLGYDRNDNDYGRRRTNNTGARAGSLKVLFYGYVNELVWFCTRLNNEFLFMFVFQLLYER